MRVAALLNVTEADTACILMIYIKIDQILVVETVVADGLNACDLYKKG